jgi:acyl-CoA-binding protein
MAITWLKDHIRQAVDGEKHWTQMAENALSDKARYEAWANAKFYMGRRQAFEDVLREIYGVHDEEEDGA